MDVQQPKVQTLIKQAFGEKVYTDDNELVMNVSPNMQVLVGRIESVTDISIIVHDPRGPDFGWDEFYFN